MAEVTGGTTDKMGGTSKKPYQLSNRRGTPVKPVTVVSGARFDGNCPDLLGYIFDCKGMGQADQFAKSKKKLANYVGRTYKQGTDTKLAVEQLSIPTVLIPGDIDQTNASASEKRIWEKQIDQYVKRLDQLEENIRTLYSIVWGQCTDALIAKVEATTDYAAASLDNNGIELLKIIKSIAFNFQSQKYLAQAVHEAKRRFYTQFQGKTMTPQEYLEQFNDHIDILTHVGAVIGPDTSIVHQIAGPTVVAADAITDAHRLEARNKYLAVAFLLGADRIRYGKLIEDMENSYLQGTDMFPATIGAVYTILANWKQDPRNMIRMGGAGSEGVVFTNNGDEPGKPGTLLTPGTILTNVGKKAGKNKDHITCFKCNLKGHYSNECPDLKTTETTAANMLIAGVE